MSAIIDTLPDPADPHRTVRQTATEAVRLPGRIGPLAAAEEPLAFWSRPRKRTPPMSPTVLRDTIRAVDGVLIMLAAPLLSAAACAGARQDAVLPILAGGIAVALLYRWQRYGIVMLRQPVRHMARVLLAGGIGGSAALCTTALLGIPVRAMLPDLVIWLLFSTALVAVLHMLLVPLSHAWMTAGRLTQHIGIIGVNCVSRRFIEHAKRSGDGSLHVFGVYCEQNVVPPALHAGLVVRGGISDLVREIRCGWVDTVVIALPAASAHLAGRICRQLESCAADVLVLPDLAGLPAGLRSPLAIAPLTTVAERPFKDWQAARKRVFDIVAGSILLLLMAPLFLLVAALIRGESPGPVLFRQRRIGFNNMEFMIYKFRTMYHDAADPDCRNQTSRNDQRVTKIGKWLRRLSIDELPQLLNVLKGDMSLVGPRPHSPNTRAGALPLDAAAVRYPNRHRVRPGITGWAQVNGFRGEIRTAEQIQNRVDHDLHYIANWSLLFDLRILGLTAMREVFSGRAY